MTTTHESRCRDCDRPRATKEDRVAMGNHRLSCDCERCVAVCFNTGLTQCWMRKVDWRLRALTAESRLADVQGGEASGKALTVAEAIEHRIIEFYEHPDWYQLRVVDGERHPWHRFRHHACRGDGWSTWRKSGAVWMRRWSQATCKVVAYAEAESDPLTRWGNAPISPEPPISPSTKEGQP